MVVVHIVWIKTKEASTQEQINAIVTGVKELEAISGVLSAEAGNQTSSFLPANG